MIKEYFRDPYGCTASIREQTTGAFRLRIANAHGEHFYVRYYRSYRGARVALGKLSDGMMELTKREEN